MDNLKMFAHIKNQLEQMWHIVEKFSNNNGMQFRYLKTMQQIKNELFNKFIKMMRLCKHK